MGNKSNLIYCTVCCAVLAAETFGDHHHPHPHAPQPMFPQSPWGAQGIAVISTSTMTTSTR
jgi:hypothetical protein